jgi:hypothetical protein
LIADALSIRYVPRMGFTLKQLFQRVNDPEAILVTRTGWRYEHQNGHTFFFHPSASVMRIKQLRRGGSDSLVEATGMKPGESVLDCTLGMGADSIVASFAVGERGKIVALESQPVIALLVKEGLNTYQTNIRELNEAMRRIEVIQADYREYLPNCPDDSFDYVLFDPMFRQTIKESAAIQALRPLANLSPLDEESVNHALRVARKAVILKERPDSGEFARLGFEVVKSSKQVAWGIRRKEGRG